MNPLNPSQKKLLTVLNLIFMLLLLAGFFYYADLGKLLQVLAETSLLFFTLSIVIAPFNTLLSTVSLWIILNKQDIRIPIFKLFSINMGIRFYSFFSPISSIASIMRWTRLVPPGKSAEGLAALGVSRMFDMVLAVTMGVFWALTAANHDVLNPWALLIYLAVLVFGLWFAFRMSTALSVWAGGHKERATSALSSRIYHGLEKLFQSLSIYRTFSTSELLTLIGTSVFSDLVGLALYLLIALSIHIPISFADLGWVRALGLLAAWSPFSLPGGFGMREVSIVVLMTGLGVGAERAGAFSLLLYLRSVVIALIGGVFEFSFNIARLGDQNVE